MGPRLLEPHPTHALPLPIPSSLSTAATRSSSSTHHHLTRLCRSIPDHRAHSWLLLAKTPTDWLCM